ncbi:unnamed protein product [Blepharisma stoltei]|uniref:Uncharacterized protein n=1 Tax=Blepharisma stoltei TaxID=1481888 RepID=A0AAU9I7M4_9CILI|nr:unnamed protein product [Blepharisma stoltei]
MAHDLLSHRKTKSSFNPTPFMPTISSTLNQRLPPKLINFKHSFQNQDLGIDLSNARHRFNAKLKMNLTPGFLKQKDRARTASRPRGQKEILILTPDIGTSLTIKPKLNTGLGYVKRSTSITPGSYRKYKIKEFKPLFIHRESREIDNSTLDFTESMLSSQY